MWDIGNALLSIFAALLGFLGIYLAGRGVDFGFQLFGGLLTLFAIVYIVGAIRRVYPSKH